MRPSSHANSVTSTVPSAIVKCASPRLALWCASASVAGAVSRSAHGPRPASASSVPFHASAVTASLAGSPCTPPCAAASSPSSPPSRATVTVCAASVPATRARPLTTSPEAVRTSVALDFEAQRARREIDPARHRRRDGPVRVERADRDAGKFQRGAARDEIEPGRGRSAGRFRLDVKFPRERARSRRPERHELRQLGRIERHRQSIARRAEAAVRDERRATELEVDRSVVHATGFDVTARRAAERGSAEMAAPPERDRSLDLPRRDEETRGLDRRVDGARGISAEARGVELRCDGVERERLPAVAIDPAGDENVARARACAESPHDDGTILERRREFDADSAGDAAIGQLAAEHARRAVEVRVDRPRESRRDQSRPELPQVDVANVEMPVGRSTPARRARCGRVRRRGRRASSATMSSKVAASSVHAKCAESVRTGARPASSGPGSAFAKSTEPARPPSAGFASTVPAIRVDGSARFQAARSTSRASTASETSGTAASGVSAAWAVARPSPAAPSTSRATAVSVPVATKSTRASRSAASPASRRRASSGERGLRPERRGARERARQRDEREPVDPMRPRIGGVAKLEAFDRSGVGADAPRERADRDALDRDLDRQFEARRRSDGAAGGFELDVERPRAEPLDHDAAREERPRPPGQRDVGRDDAGLGPSPRDSRRAHRIVQRAARALDLQRAAAPRDELAREPREPCFTREHREERERRDHERREQRRERAHEPAHRGAAARRGRRGSGRASSSEREPDREVQRAPCARPGRRRGRRGTGPSGERTRKPRP